MIKFPPERVEAHDKYSQMFDRDFPLYYTCIVYKNNWEAEVNHINQCIAKGKPAPEIKLPENKTYDEFDYIDSLQEPDTSEDTDDFDPEETLRKAEEGDLDAKWDLVCYMAISGMATEHADWEEQEIYYTNLRDLAQAGTEPAYIMLGDAILKGIGCEQNTAEAVQWYEKAVEEGDPFGNELIGEIYYKGEHAPVDYKKAFEFFTKDERKKSFCTRYHLGEMYRQGLYVDKDPVKACEYYASIVEDTFAGHELDDYYWRACYRLGVALHYGKGVERDLTRAHELLQLAKQRAEERDDNSSVADITIGEIEKEQCYLAADQGEGFKCPVCGKYEFEDVNDFGICPECGWENDVTQFEDPKYAGGANHMSLNEARATYARANKRRQ